MFKIRHTNVEAAKIVIQRMESLADTHADRLILAAAGDEAEVPEEVRARLRSEIDNWFGTIANNWQRAVDQFERNGRIGIARNKAGRDWVVITKLGTKPSEFFDPSNNLKA